MARRIDWDATNRQAKLHKWIRDHGDYTWLDELPSHQSSELDKWAKRQVRISVSRVRRRIEDEEKITTGPAATINDHLQEISKALSDDNEIAARESAELLLNFVLGLSLTSVGNQLRKQIIETLGLLLIATSD